VILAKAELPEPQSPVVEGGIYRYSV